MMKPADLEEETHAKDRITVMNVRNEKMEATTEFSDENDGGDVGRTADNDDGKEDVEDVENYETSPESVGVFYEEILNEDELQNLKAEFSRLKSTCYLDHAGATLFAASQIDSHFSELQSTLYSNPHSRNPSSTITTDAIDNIRHRILAHFGTTADEYTVIFTSGTTASLKLVAETFQFNGGLFAYLEESHTSVVGMREIVNHGRTQNVEDFGRAKLYCLSKSVMCKLMDPELSSRDCSRGSCQTQGDEFHKTSLNIHHPHTLQQKQQHKKEDGDRVNSILLSQTDFQQDSTGTLLMNANGIVMDGQNLEKAEPRNALLVYPAQCNFSGFKYPLEWIEKIQKGSMEQISELNMFYVQDDAIVKHMDTSLSTKTEKATKCKTPEDGTLTEKVNQTNKISHYPKQSDDKSNPIAQNKSRHKWFVLLDAASFVATNVLDLSAYPADFVTISFYKMFGFPTGLGALIVRNESAHVLNKLYFGGGTVNIQVPSQLFHVKRTNLHERFEDGTIPFLSILAIRDGLNTLSGLCRSMESIRERTFKLAQYFYRRLSVMCYGNGQRVAKIYSDTNFTSSRTQGPVVTFNLLRSDGSIIGYSEMEQIAYLHDVHLRYGCFCNPGACRRHLNLLPDEVIKQYEAGHVCGDLNDLIDGKPTGAIRVSIGYMTTKENLDFLLRLIHRCWIQPENFREQNENSPVSRPDILSVESTVGRNSFKERKLLRIFVYPIKSCAPFEVPKTWVIGPRGLLYDREWLIVNSAGVPLTQKREPRLCQFHPRIDISNRKLVLSMEGFPDACIPLEISTLQRDNTVKAELCASKVCGDTIMGLDCGSEVSDWLSDVLGSPGLKLIRMSPNHQRKPKNALDEISLANHSQFLLLSMGSLRRLAHELIEKGVVSYLIPSWEDTLAFEGHHHKRTDHCLEQTEKQQDQAQLEKGLLFEHQVVDNLIDRFRGNFIVGHPELERNDVPFDEEEWSEVRIGDLIFKSGGPCMRCATICTDQKTGERGSEPLLTLSAMRNGRANFGIHLYSGTSIDGNGGGSSSATTTTTTSSLLSSSVSLPIVNAQQSISPSLKEKVHIRTIKPRSGGSEDEPLQENGIATVPNGRYSVEENKTPLEKRHHRGNDDRDDGASTVDSTSTTTTFPTTPGKETDFSQRSTLMMQEDQAAAAGTTRESAQNSGIKLKNQLSSNSSSQPFTLSKSSSVKLANSFISIANQVQTIHIGDPVSTQKNQGRAVTTTKSTTNTSSSSILPTAPTTKNHVPSTDIGFDGTGQQLCYNNRSKNSSSNTVDTAITLGKSNSSLAPNGGVKSPIFRETSQVSASTQDQTRNVARMQSLIESID